MDIGGWLRSLGLEKYEAVLRDNEIDDAVLRNLTEDHLRELGFPLGARLKLLTRKLCRSWRATMRYYGANATRFSPTLGLALGHAKSRNPCAR